ncbi:MAG: hypothetical protein RMY29_009245 [Nostoc sp. CreGUA01]|nr:hypothetical protein [Nostoc sp. CreGUA01]
MSQYAWVKVKTLCKSQFFNVDAQRLAAGYRLRVASRREGRQGRKEKKEVLN